jgi:hypothetical protein
VCAQAQAIKRGWALKDVWNVAGKKDAAHSAQGGAGGRQGVKKLEIVSEIYTKTQIDVCVSCFYRLRTNVKKN